MSVTYQLQVEVETMRSETVLKALRSLDPDCLPQYVLDIRDMDPEKDIEVTGETEDTKFVGYDGHMNMPYGADTEAISERIVKAALKADPEAHVQVRWWNLDVYEPSDTFDDEDFAGGDEEQ